jgi:diguanylate cyclase (GGDEF)-like protein
MRKSRGWNRRVLYGVLRYALAQLRLQWCALPFGKRFAFYIFLALLGLLIPYGWLVRRNTENVLSQQHQLLLFQFVKASQALLENEHTTLLRECQDYSTWTDLRDAIRKKDKAWIHENVLDWVRSYQGYTHSAALDLKGRVLYRAGSPPTEIVKNPLIQQAIKGKAGAGILQAQGRLYHLVCAPILGSEFAPPQVGVLVFARLADGKQMAHLWNQLGSQVSLLPTAPDAPANNSSLPVIRTEGTEVCMQATLFDPWGKACGLLETRVSQSHLEFVNVAAERNNWYLLGFGLLLIIGIVWLLVGFLRYALYPFVVASNQLASGNWEVRVAYPARDEFGELARAFNRMAGDMQDSFEKQHHQRQEIEHQKAELEALYEQLQSAHTTLENMNKDLREANAQLEEASITDGLTGLRNHRAFQEALTYHWQMSQRNGQPLSLIMLDIDYFKQFNDTYGHPAGDELLRQVAAVLSDSARAYDVAARYGGEEFAVLLPNTGMDEAIAAAERLREEIENIRNRHTSITASFGVAATHLGHTMPATLLYQADKALYAAKRSGRNRVCIAEEAAA